MSDTIHPVGTYEATILSHYVDEGQNTPTPYLAVKFQTTQGHVTGFFYLSDRAIEHSMKKIIAMGYTGASMSDLNGDNMVGNKCVIKVSQEEYQGTMRAKVGWVYPEGWEPGGNDDVAKALTKFDGLLHKIQNEQKKEKTQGTLKPINELGEEPPF